MTIPGEAKPAIPPKHKVDKDLKPIAAMGDATQVLSRRLVSVGLALLFLVAVGLAVSIDSAQSPNGLFIIAAAVVGGYMALNIGANDVANNVAPAVGSRALTMFGALVIAAIFEAAGAMLAGADVVQTISKDLVDPQAMADSQTFIMVMIAALLAAALWINLATWMGAPVSTTHSIVGAVVGAGAVSAGLEAVAWGTMGKIAASWVISPVLGGGVSALLLWFIKIGIIYRDDKISAALRWVPVLNGVMASSFGVYLATKGLKNVWSPSSLQMAGIGVALFAVTWGLSRLAVRRAAAGLENRRKSVSSLFTIPLIASAALLSFAHGANDVANAVGPLAAIVGVAGGDLVGAKVSVPHWVMLVGAVGISLGLSLFGPALIRTVGEQITKLDQTRAFCVALSAAVTVIVASALGLPVSSTHIAVGAVFGVGFLREFYANRRPVAVKPKKADASPAAWERKVAKAERRKLVRRRHALAIAAAWVITVPLSAGLSAVLYLILQGLIPAPH